MSAEPPVINPAPDSAVIDGRPAVPPGPVTSLSDPRVVQIMATEHWSLLASRSLAYNEAFIRGGMFLTFLSMSFVALALLAQAMSFTSQFLIVAIVVLAFNFIIGLLTYMRIFGANSDDFRAVHGMARIRHGYTQIAPMVVPYFTSATFDDIPSVQLAYGGPSTSTLADLTAGLSSSGGMIGLITTMVGGVLLSLVSILLGASGELAIATGLVSTAVIFVLLAFLTLRAYHRDQANFSSNFPAPVGHKTEDAAPAQAAR